MSTDGDSHEVRRYLIDGRVQGVGFRWFTREEAQGLGLAGWVRNLADGRVEAMAAGPVSTLESFEGILRQGPPASRVEQVDCHPLDAEDGDDLPRPFSIAR